VPLFWIYKESLSSELFFKHIFNSLKRIGIKELSVRVISKNRNEPTGSRQTNEPINNWWFSGCFFFLKNYLKFNLIYLFFWELWLCIRNGSLIFKNCSYESEQYYPDICQRLVLFFVSNKCATTSCFSMWPCTGNCGWSARVISSGAYLEDCYDLAKCTFLKVSRVFS
jgi:hypothetical protein